MSKYYVFVVDCLTYICPLLIVYHIFLLLIKINGFTFSSSFSKSLDSHLPSPCQNHWIHIFLLLVKINGFTFSSSLSKSIDSHFQPPCFTFFQLYNSDNKWLFNEIPLMMMSVLDQHIETRVQRETCHSIWTHYTDSE